MVRQEISQDQRDKLIWELRRRGWTYRRIAKEVDMTAAESARPSSTCWPDGLARTGQRCSAITQPPLTRP